METEAVQLSKHYKLKGKGGRGKKAAAKIALTTILTVFVAGVICLVTCWITFKWRWEQVAYWLNPFSEGNNWTWLIYFGLVFFGLIVIWLIHKARMDKIMDEGK